MSETFLQEIADQLRNQTSPADATAETATQTSAPADTAEEKVEPQTNTSTETQQQSTQTDSKAWYEEEPSTKVETQSTETKTESKAETAQELDPDLKLLLEYKKSGKTLKDFVSEYKVEDYSTWADEKIVFEGLKDFMKLSEEEIEQAKYEFETGSILQKKQLVESFRQKYEQKNEQLLKQLTSSNTQIDERQNAISQIFNDQLESYSKNVVDQEVYGLKITDEMSKDLKNFIEKEFTLQRADGTFDIEKMYSIGLWLKYGKDLVKSNITKAKNEGKEQVIREVSNPSKNNTGGGRVVGSGLEAAQEAFNNLFPG
jgi:hypothetical protein